jgi:hypothetical protein
MNRFWKWAIGAGVLFWGFKALADDVKKKPGELFFRINFSVPQVTTLANTNQHTEAINRLTGVLKNFVMSRPCSGLPVIKELLSTKTVSPTGTIGSRGNSLDATFMAEWTHDKLGDVKPEVLQCVTRYLKGLEPEISIDSVSVSRIS